MRFLELAKFFEKIEKISSKLEKTRLLALFLKEVDENELKEIIYLIRGRVFPDYVQKELGIATQLMIKAISKVSGFGEEEIEEIYKEEGDLGLAAEKCLARRKQVVLFKKPITVKDVYKNLAKLPEISGEGAIDRKLAIISEILSNAEPIEARYIVRIILNELRIGVAEGIIRDAIALAFLPSLAKEKAIELVDYAWNILSDFGEVALIAKKQGEEGLRKVKPVVGRPLQPMLGIAVNSIDEVLKRHKKVIVEFKYDGMRMAIHKKGSKVWIFSRRLEDVTKQFPDVVKAVNESIVANECIVEGEGWPIDKKTGKPLPFQKLSQRVQRKYNIEKMAEEIPVKLNLFDVIYVDGQLLINKPLIERIKVLEKIVKKTEHVAIAERIISSDIKEIEEFYHKALSLNQEGIMLKNPEAPYIFGRHVGGWYKIKPTMETLDLVIVAAEWGEGKRSKWLTSYYLAVRDADTGQLLTCGKVSTGLTEEEYENMTEMLKPLIIKEEGKHVLIKPKIVVEVSYQEIQKSPTYDSGYALRFPRIKRIRVDKSVEEADTLERLENLYKLQGKTA